MTSRWLGMALAAVLAAPLARADIYEWRDGSGARHFTNDKRGVPAQYQDTASILVAEWRLAAPAPAPAGAAPAAPVAPAAPAASVEVVTDHHGWEDGYQAGLQAGMSAVGGGGGSGGAVQISGPLAVAVSHASESTAGYGDGLYPRWPWYYPFVTTSFDRGRSRHQTLRMLLQDQFQIDRDGPYAYDRWTAPGLGPALAPFLSRGLPFGVKQYGRVIYR